MAQNNNKLVIFLAFANDRDDSLRYLRNLPDEARRLREVLEPAEKAGLCEVVVRTNCTAGDIFKVFQDPQYRNRIAIFHYGGHANGYQLLLESASGQAVAANAGGFAAFLAQQQGMQLVFLNGCSTREQTQDLLDANIPSVISTSRSIDDKVATDFAFHFYQGLAGGATIQTAYKEAEAVLKTSKGDNTREAYVEDPDGTQDQAGQIQPELDRWPWDLNLSEGAESAALWNLPEAVGDPLFGLPSLPEQDLPESPYRHLNWFTRKDAEVFFGRGYQIRELYDRLTAPHTAPVLLFYGQSGVGKSSVLDAGLIPRLERDYEVRYLRRSSDGLLETLQSVFGTESTVLGLDPAWRKQEERTGKPLIVFLDQVEEVFTRPVAGLTDEMDQFIQALEVIFNDPARRPKGKLVLGFRKEWLAELETHLVNHEIPRSKVFLQPLDRRGVIEVVRGPTESRRLRDHYGLTVEDDLPEIIADDLIEDRDSAVAPTLQILLTKLWAKAKEENYERPKFTQELYQTLKRDGILLRDFLNQQIAAFREQHPEVVDSGLLIDILAMHTTALGTAGQCSLEQLQKQYAHLGATLPDLLQRCQDLHLLTVATTRQKDSSKTTRLAHDTLAPLIRERFEESDKPGQRARRILDNRSVDWAGDKVGIALDEADLAVVEQGALGTRVLSATEQRLVDASRASYAKARRIRLAVKMVGTVMILVIIVAAVLFRQSDLKAQRALLNGTFKSAVQQVKHREAFIALDTLVSDLGGEPDIADASGDFHFGELFSTIPAWDTASQFPAEKVLDVIERAHPGLVVSRTAFGGVMYALNDIAVRNPSLRGRATALRETVRTSFIRKHGLEDLGMQNDPLNRAIEIQGGTFRMGSDDGSRSTDSDKSSGPSHRVTLSGFWIQEHPVTFAEYLRFDPKLENEEDSPLSHPVSGVTWYEAVAYAAWLGGNLPTEAQWEFTARGSEGRTYPWGNAEPTCKHANYNDCSESLGNVMDVMSWPEGKTPEGVHDMAGNLFEFTLDWYGPYSIEDVVDPIGPGVGEVVWNNKTERSVRGGSATFGIEEVRSFIRRSEPPESTYGQFRVVWPSFERQD